MSDQRSSLLRCGINDDRKTVLRGRPRESTPNHSQHYPPPNKQHNTVSEPEQRNAGLLKLILVLGRFQKKLTKINLTD